MSVLIRNGGGSTRVKVDGKPITEKLNFKKVEIEGSRMQDVYDYNVLKIVKINKDVFAYAYATSSYISDTKYIRGITFSKENLKTINIVIPTNDQRVLDIFTGNEDNTIYHINITGSRRYLKETKINFDSISTIQTELFNEDDNNHLDSGIYLDENTLLLVYYRNAIPSLYRYNKINNSKTLLLSNIDSQNEHLDFIGVYKNNVYYENKYKHHFCKYDIEKNEVTILFKPEEKFNKPNFSHSVSIDANNNNIFYFYFFSGDDKKIIRIKYDLDTDKFESKEIECSFIDKYFSDLKVFESDSINCLLIYGNRGWCQRTNIYAYSLLN